MDKPETPDPKPTHDASTPEPKPRGRGTWNALGQRKAKRKRAAKTAGKNARKFRRIDWTHAESLYVGSLTMTYEQVGQAIGAHPSTVANYAWKHGWTAKRDAGRAKLVGQAIKNGLSDVKEAAVALVNIEVAEGHAMLGLLQRIRQQATMTTTVVDQETGETKIEQRVLLKTGDVLTYGRAVECATGLIRRALGLPTVITEVKGEGGEGKGKPDFNLLDADDLLVLRDIAKKARPQLPPAAEELKRLRGEGDQNDDDGEGEG